MNNIQNSQLNKKTSINELIVGAKIRVGRSAEKIAEVIDIPLEEVEKIQDKYWEEYVSTLA